MSDRLPLSEKLSPKHTALVVIDVQVDFCSPNGFLAKRGRDLSMMEPMVDRLKQVIDTAGRAGVLTLYTQQVYDRTKLNELQKEQYDLDGKLITCDADGDGYKFYRIQPSPDKVYLKYNYNAFSNPAFDKALRDSGIKSLVITGVDTQYCVETAIRNGFDLGYKIVAPTDLMATSAKHMDMHKRTLELVRKTYGVLINSEELMKIWESA
jgi:ureidoacrylate peracid hydrolase